MPVRDMTPEELAEWEAQRAKQAEAMKAWEEKRKLQMVEEAKLKKVMEKGTEAELVAAIEAAKNVKLELGPPINIRAAELRLMDLRGEERPDVFQYLRKVDEAIASGEMSGLQERAWAKWRGEGDQDPPGWRKN